MMKYSIRRINVGDEKALLRFYNGLSRRSIRTFRPLGESTDLKTCVSIIEKNQPDEESRFDLVAISDGCIIGWSFLCDIDTEKPSFGLAVADHYQNKGIGSQLMDEVMDAARDLNLPKVFLTVVQDNDVAWKMYEKRGFRKYGERVGEDGLHYYCMIAELKKGGE